MNYLQVILYTIPIFKVGILVYRVILLNTSIVYSHIMEKILARNILKSGSILFYLLICMLP